MNSPADQQDKPGAAGGLPQPAPDYGLRALTGIAAFYRIAADPVALARELALGERQSGEQDILRAGKLIGMKLRAIALRDAERFKTLPFPSILHLKSGEFTVFGGPLASGHYRIVDPVTRRDREISAGELFDAIEPRAILVARRWGGAGVDPRTFGFRWFLPSIWRYRKPLMHVIIASFFVQLFALVTPLFFQVVIDKVLAHRGYETLYVIVAGLVLIGLFDVILQYLRTYALAHTTNRIDVELGQRLFHHLLRLPLGYFETRAAGQTVARMRELENIRSFLTGQGLFSALDLFFTFVFIAVLFIYSWKLTLIVIFSIPVYLAIAFLVRPHLRNAIEEKFTRGAQSQQFLVETVVGVQTIKAAAVEPAMQVQWEERLAAYVRTAFQATMVSALGQNAIQYVNKLTTALLLLFGAKAVLDNELSVGELIAFNMIANQVTQPILRLSQLWQDFQQVQVSVERLGDILNAPQEPRPAVNLTLPPPRGAIEFRNVVFRYSTQTPDVLRNVNLRIRPGEVIGIVGPSGSGKSTLTKLMQRLYMPTEGQVMLDGLDMSQVNPSWLRANTGVVLQESLLFNRSIHDNIALSNPAMPRAQVINIARLAGADEFIAKMPQGYDTIIEERGANLSGGQRQRIAIARALAANPPILIFDEATSALDYESERIIQNNMRHIVANRTVIIIAHRLAAVRHCHRIIGMVEGRIIEQGTHDELVGNPKSLYARLWAMQSDRGSG
ncbi:MAG: type I secretion system permease/ATPase [Alphaproteobacteria bacterium]|nr:type I secretion system permease/ATPase [Alphaproteobacteria bacterium]